MEPDLARYARQTIFPGIGEPGQRRLLDARVTIIGVGATGSVLANHMARAGVGHLRIVDRDFVELNNLQRQLLYDEDDVTQMLPKAVAAARKLRRINSTIEIEEIVADVNATNIIGLISDAGVVLDGTDNFSTRYLLNDACVKLGKPWVYCGVLASYGMTHTVQPGVTACLRCIMGELPAPGTVATCDTVGIIGPIVALMGSVAAAEALKLLVGKGEVNTGMVHVDLWEGSFDTFELGPPRPDCPACGTHQYEFLSTEAGTRTTSLCGRDAVQVSVTGSRGAGNAAGMSLEDLAERLRQGGALDVRSNPFLLRATVDGREFTVFPDGRAIIKGVQDEAQAATLYARYVGA
ncbi:MAG: ThiF family adenylyltransferase [Nitrososphaerales archaeon]